MRIDVAIELVIPDNTAFTVRRALRELGYAELQRVERFAALALTVEDRARPGDVVDQLARAEILFNPNKHHMSFALANAQSVQPPQFEALVRDKDESDERVRELLRTAFAMTSLRSIERATGWRLYERGGGAPADRLQWACAALLANPVSQCYEIRPRPVRTQFGGAAAGTAKTTK
jgi:phosphoribosylformylglycinamidine (FGAM) synthase PurS component